jgi:hypothetical protein
MIENEQVLRDFVLEAVSNDYESFEQILEQVVRWSSDRGLSATRAEIIPILENAIRDGYVQAYILSAEQPHTQIVEFSLDRLDSLWFYVTPKGKQFVTEL